MNHEEIEQALSADRDVILDRMRDLIKDCAYYEPEDGMDVRLQWHNGWSLHSGDSSYDQDHRGFWGASSIDADSDPAEVVDELIDQVLEAAACCPEGDEQS